MKEIEKALCRELTDIERRYLDWIAGLDKETNEVIHGLLWDLWRAGQKDATAAREVVSLFPRQPAKKDGWEISTDFLMDIRSKATELGMFESCPSWGDIEAVLLALEAIQRIQEEAKG
ncbi:hypothetical protein [Paenibacillus sp. OSY-SE]|uniref:hypothetical protein n=1 Tax=Paenibacillus sp. OSY-SE TaxID=1196323 RepID=UPI0002E7B4C7|nr:hypothetical protein [Paenibacillus sp. OSY-SE]